LEERDEGDTGESKTQGFHGTKILFETTMNGSKRKRPAGRLTLKNLAEELDSSPDNL
jgi:hypothetical protein